jgi:hypothetical protein
MTPKRITIEMSAVGAPETAAAIGTTTEAVQDLTAAERDHATESRQQEQIGLVRAQTYMQLARAISQVGGAVSEMAEGIRRDAPEMAAKLDTASEALQYAGNAADMAAKGFAIAGPAGAAVGAALGLALKPVKDFATALWDLHVGLKEVEDSFESLARVEDEIKELRFLSQVRRELTGAREAAEAYIASMERAKTVGAARDAADKSAGAVEDFDEIAAGANPLDVRARRVRKDAAQARGALTREGQRISTLRAQQEIEVEKAEGYLVAGGGGEAEQSLLDKAREKLAEIEKKERDYDLTEADRRRKIDEDEKLALRKIEAERQRKQEEEELRAGKEREKYMDQDDAMNRRIEQDEKASARAAARDRLTGDERALDDSAGKAAGEFGTRAGTAPTRATAATFANISKKLSDGTNEKELRGLAAEFENAVAGSQSATVESLRVMLASMQKQAREIEQLREQIKNSARK